MNASDMPTDSAPTADATAAACPICLGRSFRPVESLEFGNWEPERGDPASAALTAWSVRLDIGRCDGCGHVMITTPYDDAMISRIYLETQQDEVYWGDSVTDAMAPYRDMVTFAGTLPVDGGCDEGAVADLGCGTGKLIRAIREIHSLPAEKVIGIDFNRRVDPGVPFIRADLDRLSPDELPPDCRFVFAAHLLEHLRDPRRFLGIIARALPADGGIFVEVPDAADDDPALVGPVNLVNQQHIHYYSPRSLWRLLVECGFSPVTVERLVTGGMPRLRLLARRGDATAATPPSDLAGHHDTAAAVAAHVRALRAKRRALAEAALERIARDGRVGLWGLGADFRRTLAENPALSTEIASGRVVLFDQGLAGRTFAGRRVLETRMITDTDAGILITPILGDVRARMRRFAATLGIGGARVLDVHGTVTRS